MTNSKTVEVTGTIVDLLTPLESEQRLRVVQAALALLGEKAGTLDKNLNDGRRNGSTPEMESLPPRAQIWVKQNEIGFEELEQVFHLASGGAEVILVPGKNRKEQTLNAYVLTGIANLLVSGSPAFDDKVARVLCTKFGCYDADNHAAYMKGKGNEFTGSKDKGWTLTAPGLKRGAELIRAVKTQ